MNNKHSKQGFTLIEVLIALVVFAILATITSSAMYQAFNTRTRIAAQTNALSAIQLALTIITRDTQQIIERPVRTKAMRLLSPVIGHPHYFEFTRAGLPNPNGLEPRSTLQRVALLCTKHTLIRRSWDSLDDPTRKHYEDKILLDHLDQCKFAYLNHTRDILSEWRAGAVQVNQKKEPLPIALQLTLNIQGQGNMSLLFALPKALYD